MKSSCELGNEPLGSIKCWELLNGCTTCGFWSGTQLQRGSLVGWLCKVNNFTAICEPTV
jgi:hypothetical protein